MFRETDLMYASNTYHRLDKSGNFNQNKAFAMTIINDLKARARQDEYATKIGNQQQIDD